MRNVPTTSSRSPWPVHNGATRPGAFTRRRLSNTQSIGPDDAKLPYLEQGAIYNSINFVFSNKIHTDAIWALQLDGLLHKVSLGLLCPSDDNQLDDNSYGPNNYMANAGSAPNSPYGGNYATPANGPSAGPFLWYANLQPYETALAGALNNGRNFAATTFASILDGLSNTAARSANAPRASAPQQEQLV